MTTALKDIHDCQQVDVLTRPRPHVANVDYDCSSIEDITPKADLSLSKDCSDSAPPIDETARGCTDSLHCSGCAKCDCDVKTSSMTVKVPEESTELAPSTIVDQGVGDVEYSRARIHLGNFSQDSTELASRYHCGPGSWWHGRHQGQCKLGGLTRRQRLLHASLHRILWQ